MAPTPHAIYEYLENRLSSRFPGHAWTYKSLVDQARRNFNSTTPAIQTRVDELINKGLFVGLRVSHDGLVFWKSDVGTLPTAFLDRYVATRYDNLEHGSIVLQEDRKDNDNLWANGTRIFYMLKTEYEALVETMRGTQEQKVEELRHQKYAEKIQIREALTQAAPEGDGLALLKALKDSLPSSDMHVFAGSSLTDPDVSKTTITLMVDQDDLAAFLINLRDGVVVPEEPKDNVVLIRRVGDSETKAEV
jgi:hypothetical protein